MVAMLKQVLDRVILHDREASFGEVDYVILV